jgi:hypothetical protein
MQGLTWLRALVGHVPARLEQLPAATAENKPAPSNWSPKAELGHRLDSAANNHQRIVRTSWEDRPALPGYDGDGWVELHAYQKRDGRDLVEFWRALNLQLLAAAQAVPLPVR